jgi:DHA2 family multidrug resistance protein
VNIPIGITATFLSWTYITNRPGAVKPKKIDWWGIVFLVIAIGSLQFVLEEGTSKDWFESAEICVMALLAVFGLVAFIYRELSIDYPAVNIRLYKNYNLMMGSIMNLMLGMLLFGTVFIFPLFVQISLGWTPLQTGLFMIPGALCSAFAMPLVANLLSKGANPKAVIIIGVLMTFGFVLLLSTASPDSNQNNFYFPFVLRGFGLAFMMSPILALAVGGLKGKDMVQAVGLANMVRQLGGAIGIALINLYLTNINADIRANMISYINPYNQIVNDRLSMMTQNFQAQGFDPERAQALANNMLEGALFKQQAMVSYDHGFLMVAITILIAIPVTLLIRYKKSTKMKMVSDH